MKVFRYRLYGNRGWGFLCDGRSLTINCGRHCWQIAWLPDRIEEEA